MEKYVLGCAALVVIFHFSTTTAAAAQIDSTSVRDTSKSASVLFFSSPPKPLIQESSSKPIMEADRSADAAPKMLPASVDDDHLLPDPAKKKELEKGFQWGSALKQSLLFLSVQHGYAFTQPKTRRAIKGKFFKNYIDSVKSLHGWEDGGRFFTNYIAHPMQGSLTGFIQIQNDPAGRSLKFGRSKKYWQSLMKAMAWSAAFSTQFEIGPISQASIGNVGTSGKQTYVDLVVTPTIGTAWLVTEDALDRFAISWVERRNNNLLLRIGARMLLNPMRSCANLLRFKKPWHRDP